MFTGRTRQCRRSGPDRFSRSSREAQRPVNGFVQSTDKLQTYRAYRPVTKNRYSYPTTAAALLLSNITGARQTAVAFVGAYDDRFVETFAPNVTAASTILLLITARSIFVLFFSGHFRMLLFGPLVRPKQRGLVRTRHLRRARPVFIAAVFFAVAPTAVLQSAYIPRNVIIIIIIIVVVVWFYLRATLPRNMTPGSIYNPKARNNDKRG